LLLVSGVANQYRWRSLSARAVGGDDLIKLSPPNGFVTLSNEERDKAAARVFSSDRDRLAPRVHRRRVEGAVCLGGYEVALDVEKALSR
jgi:hypothetical protein